MTTDQPSNPEPAIEIDYREVARLAREAFMRDTTVFPSNALAMAEDHLRAEARYLASKGVTPAEDPRDAEIRGLRCDNATLESNQMGLLHDKRNLTGEVDYWRARALAAEAKEPTIAERLVRFALEAKALKFEVFVARSGTLVINGLRVCEMAGSQAAAVRAALGEA